MSGAGACGRSCQQKEDAGPALEIRARGLFPLRDALRQTEWVVLTNFERGQKAYATALTRLVTTEDTRRGDAAIFRDALFETIVVRSSVLLARL